MAQDTSINGLRNQILTGLYGRKLGFDPGNYLLGVHDLRVAVESLTSATTLVAKNYGITRLDSIALTTTFTMDLPAPGTVKRLVATTTSTLGNAITLTAGNFFTTASATLSIATFLGRGQALELVGLTTALAYVSSVMGLSTGPALS